jgi:hypothetical protein
VTTPFPGLVAPSPRTWSQGDFITTPRLRGDMTNFGGLFAGQGRPVFLASFAASFALSSLTVTLLPFNSEVLSLNTWNVQVINAARNNPYYLIPLPGYYLVQGDVSFSLAGSPASFRYLMGFNAVVNGAGAVNNDGGGCPASATAADAGAAGCELIQFNSNTNSGDTLAVYAYTSNSSAGHVQLAELMAEWVALPSQGSALTNYTGPYGTVVGSPAGALSFPAGPGTTLTAPVSAGATSVKVADPTGMITGGTLGLDVINGNRNQDYAEAVSITSVTGATIGISAAAYAHSSGAPVAVPVSAAFLNQQDRDLINFLSYPPMCRAVQTSVQSIPSSGFPGTTVINSMSATIDNFGGFSGGTTYTVPVSGVYHIYGQVYYNGSATGYAAGAGIKIGSGTTQWGTVFAFNGGSVVQFAATVRRNLRLVAGQTIQLIAYQAVGSAMNTAVSLPGGTSKLIVVFRGF